MNSRNIQKRKRKIYYIYIAEHIISILYLSMCLSKSSDWPKKWLFATSYSKPRESFSGDSRYIYIKYINYYEKLKLSSNAVRTIILILIFIHHPHTHTHTYTYIYRCAFARDYIIYYIHTI